MARARQNEAHAWAQQLPPNLQQSTSHVRGFFEPKSAHLDWSLPWLPRHMRQPAWPVDQRFAQDLRLHPNDVEKVGECMQNTRAEQNRPNMHVPNHRQH
jgi:hypothetical protein